MLCTSVFRHLDVGAGFPWAKHVILKEDPEELMLNCRRELYGTFGAELPMGSMK